MNATLNESRGGFTCHDVIPGSSTGKVITTGIGSFISYCGLGANGLIFYVFQKNRHLHNSSTIYLQLLCIFDIGVSISYLLLYKTNILATVYRSFWMYDMWARMVPFLYPSARITHMITKYTMVVVTMEPLQVGMQFAGIRRKSAIKITLVIVVAFFSHLSRFWEIRVFSVDARNCTSTMQIVHDITASKLRFNTLYNTAYGMWYTSITNTLIPFLALIIACVRNSRKLRMSVGTLATTRRKSTVAAVIAEQRVLRDNVKVLSILCVNYILSNILAVVVSIVEFIDKTYLQKHQQFYTMSVEVINLLPVANSAGRIINYVAFNHAFRNALQRRKEIKYETLISTLEKQSSATSLRRKRRTPRSTAVERIAAVNNSPILQLRLASLTKQTVINPMTTIV